jgi:cyclase
MTPSMRVAVRLDIKSPNVVKGVQMEGLRVVGAPSELAPRYYAAGADEIIFIDTVASLYGRNTILETVQAAARGVFVPMTVGGGIRSVDDIRAVLRAGADKVAINTAAHQAPDFLAEAASMFGSQCIVLSVEAKRMGDGRWQAYTDNGREPTGRDVVDWVCLARERGVGEVLLTAVDRDGTRKGFDVDLVAAVSRAVSLPVVAAGGAGSVGHVVEVAGACRPSAVACGSLFHHGLASVAEVKDALGAAGFRVRPAAEAAP